MEAMDALGNATRRAIVERLREGPRDVGDLHRCFPEISRPAVSRHLRLLRQAELVDVQADGTRNLYTLRPGGFDALRPWFEQFWDDALPRFAMVAENLEDP